MAKDLLEVFKEVKERSSGAIYNLAYQRTDSLSDRFFYSVGAEQWNRDFKQGIDNKVRFVLNRTHNIVVRTMNDINKCEMSVTYLPKREGISQKVSDLACGLYRADCNDFNIEAVKKVMHEEGVGGGMGAMEWDVIDEDEESLDEYKRIVPRAIEDADLRVFFDPNASEYDKSDAKYCFVLDFCSEKEWKERWPGKRVEAFGMCGVIYYTVDPKNTTNSPFAVPDSKNSICYAKYYEVQYENREINRYISLTGEIKDIATLDLNDDVKTQLENSGFIFQFAKRKKIRRIRKYFLSGSEVLEDCGYIQGKYIPVAPFYHKRWRVYGVEQFQGVVRLLRDPSIIENSIISSIGEVVLSNPRAVPIFHPTQLTQDMADKIAYKDIWRLPFIFASGATLNGIEQPLTPPPMIPPPQISPQIMDLFNITEGMFKDLTGNLDEGQKIRANISAEAISLVQKEISTFSEMPLKNAEATEKHIGRIWLSMAREVYTEKERLMKTISENGETAFLTLGSAIQTDDGGIGELSLKDAPLETVVSVDMSTQTKQEATLNALIKMLSVATGIDPQTQTTILLFAIKNMAGEGLAHLKDWANDKLVELGAVPPTPEQQEEMQQRALQQQTPTPLDQLTITQAQKNVAQTEKTRVETALKQVEIDNTKADTARIIKEVLEPKEVQLGKKIEEY